ncbi:MAG: hypothetical protein EBY81_07260 [Verrucomicrobia bacterium]|nr:hypothetical protein [Verrucomicrobiota bacterium]
MEKTFKFAGVSTRNGVIKARFANDQMRVKVLAKTGSSDIDLIELKEPMTKAAAIQFLISINFDNGNANIRAALEEGLEKRTPAVRAVKAVKAKAAPKAKSTPTMDAIKARAVAAKAKAPKVDATLEEAPF